MVGDAQKNVDFYAGVLAYRLVKKTLNHSDKNMYHLYFGNGEASTAFVTTFPMNHSKKGVVGSGQLGVASFGIRPASFDFWKKRLEYFGIETVEYIRFNKRRLAFKDLDGLELELIETNKGPKNTWEFNGVEEDNAIIGIDRSMIYSKKPDETLNLLTKLLGYSVIDEDAESYLLKTHNNLGGLLELTKKAPRRGIPGIGTVHHIALSVNNDEIDDWKVKLEEQGYRPTEVIDRKYFKSLYFREEGRVLIELATKGPGILIDEDLEKLGEELIIPDHYKNGKLPTIEPVAVREVQKIIN